MRLYRETLAGNLAEAKRIQFKLLDLIEAMLYGTNFPEGFRAGMSLRGFNLGTSRQLLSPKEQSDLENIRAKVACILAECGYEEAAHACRRQIGAAVPPPRRDEAAVPVAGGSPDVDRIVQEVMKQLRASKASGKP